MSASFRVNALPAKDLARIRSRGVDDFGNPLVVRTHTGDGGIPLRCCLRDARGGERYVLIAWQPAKLGGPYAEVGPVFIHAGPCGGYADGHSYPAGFRYKKQLFRAYDENGAQVENEIIDGEHAESAVAQFFGRPEVAYLHSRNVLAGCYMFAIHRRD